MARTQFHRYAWGLLVYNLLTILGGAYVRATMSGDGCGNNWPNCNGEIIPHAPALKTAIEYTHRASTGLLGILALVLLVWALAAFPRKHPVRLGALLVVALVIVEALIGKALVDYKLVAHDESIYRAIAMPSHLVATFLLLASSVLTVWWSSGETRPSLRGQGAMGWGMGVALLAALLLGVSGAITALGDTLHPAGSLAEGLRQDFAPGTSFLLGLRIYHPLIAVSAGIYLMLIAGLAMQLRPSPGVVRYSRAMIGIFSFQLAAGVVNLLLRAPVWMQLVHLLLADLFWIALVFLAAATLSEGVPQGELSAPPAEPVFGRPRVRDYLALTKPRVISLLLFTALMAMPIAAGRREGLRVTVWLYLAVAIGFYAAAGAANAINMVLERDLDERMGRTATRPTVTQRVPPRAALQFALLLTVGSFLILWLGANLLSAMLALAGLAFYVVIYTMTLKRRTWTNIVIGGAAGAFPPLVGWAAVTGKLTPLAWCLFAIIFLWTPVHFWALAILLKEDYARAGVPMLPVVRGERATVIQIAVYTVLTAVLSIAPVLLRGPDGQPAVGGLYLGAGALLNAFLLLRTLQLYRHTDRPNARSLFHYSMVYLALLFLAMAVDRAHWI